MMRVIYYLSLVFVVIAAPRTASRGAETLEGVWKTEAISMRGKRVDEPRKGAPLTTFTNSEMIIDDGENVFRFKYKTDATADPCEMDQTMERDGRIYTTRSIYKRLGDALTIASSIAPGGPRPRSFSPDQTPDLLVTSLRLLSPQELRELRKMGEDGPGEAAMTALRELGARFDMNTNRRVRTVMLSHTRVSDGDLKQLASLKELDSVSLAETSVGNGGMTHLTALDHLRRLNLSMTEVDDNGLQALSRLSNLEVLDLIGTGITDASVDTLSKLKRLKEVDLSLTKVTPQGKERLSQALPDCSVK